MNEFAIDVTDAEFEQAVLVASHAVPVIVDFWAPWCQPCRVLKPILEKLAAEYGGRIRLAKVNSDENPESARLYGVRGIPAVKAFVRGELVNEFSGALPERQVRDFIDRLLPSPALPLIEAAQAALDAADPQTSLALLADAEAVARDVSDRTQINSLRARIQLMQGGDVDLVALQAAVTSQPDNLDSRLQLANGLAARGDYRAACDHLLGIVQRDRRWQDEGGRKALLTLFALLAAHPEHADLVREFRVKLARTLN